MEAKRLLLVSTPYCRGQLAFKRLSGRSATKCLKTWCMQRRGKLPGPLTDVGAYHGDIGLERQNSLILVGRVGVSTVASSHPASPPQQAQGCEPQP